MYVLLQMHSQCLSWHRYGIQTADTSWILIAIKCKGQIVENKNIAEVVQDYMFHTAKQISVHFTSEWPCIQNENNNVQDWQQALSSGQLAQPATQTLDQNSIRQEHRSGWGFGRSHCAKNWRWWMKKHFILCLNYITSAVPQLINSLPVNVAGYSRSHGGCLHLFDFQMWITASFLVSFSMCQGVVKQVFTIDLLGKPPNWV